MKNPLRAGLVGLGMMGRHHARVLASLDGVDLVAIADPGGGLPGQAQGAPVVPSLSALLDMGLDCAVVASPTRFHRETALALAEAGVHTLVEKPLSTESRSALEIAEAFESRGLVGQIAVVNSDTTF